MISAVIITWNEQGDIAGCLDTLQWCDDIHVLDSFSTDQTVAIARSHGASVTQRAFAGYAAQRNAALRNLAFKYAWVLLIDADERIPTSLQLEMWKFVSSAPPEVAGARLRRRDFLFGTWLKHAAITPYYIRLVRHDQAFYEREINEIIRVNGEVVTLAEPFNHYPFSKGIDHWIDKHNRYSTLEARQALADRGADQHFKWITALCSRDPTERRRHQKGLFYRLPGRPGAKLLYMLFWRRAFLDGRAGITYAFLQSIYEFFIVLKEREIRAHSARDH